MTNNLLDSLNEGQRAAASHVDGPAMVQAAAGTGKTTTVVHRMANLILNHNVDPKRIGAFTFTKAAAQEMQERVMRLTGADDVRVGTIHSLALEIVRDIAPMRVDVDDGKRFRSICRDVMGWRNMKWGDGDLGKLLHLCTMVHANAINPMHKERWLDMMVIAKAEGLPQPEQYCKALQQAVGKMQAARLMSFDMFALKALELLEWDEEAWKRWANRFDYLIQDEAQDQNYVQARLLTALAEEHNNYMQVGDPAQCHPPGVEIQTPTGPCCIEELYMRSMRNEAVRVSSWNRQAQTMIKSRKAVIARRPFDGSLVHMTAAGRTVPMTPDHKVLCRWTDRDDQDTCVVYLMYREDLGYRIGWCQLFSGSGFHLRHRMRLEKADRLWILETHRRRREASLRESILSARYGVPTVLFEPTSGNKHYDAEGIAQVFRSVDSITAGERCLSSFGLDPRLPSLPYPQLQTDDPKSAYRRSTYFAVHAANLIPGLMSVPLPDARNRWAKIEAVARTPYTGEVYSLDVDVDHSYAANGVVVLNCIYGWRGSDPDLMTMWAEDMGASVYVIDWNYRSKTSIIVAANRTVEHIDDGTALVGTRPERGTIEVWHPKTHTDEAQDILDHVRQMRDFDRARTVILSRTASALRTVEDELIEKKIPHINHSGGSFYNRKEIGTILDYLRVALGDDDYRRQKRTLCRPFRFIGNQSIDAMKAAGRDDLVAGAEAVLADSQQRDSVFKRPQQATATEKWLDVIYDLAELEEDLREAAVTTASEDAAPRGADELIKLVRSRCRILDWLAQEDGQETVDSQREANIEELTRLAGTFATGRSLLAYIEGIENRRAAMTRSQRTGAVNLMTIHKSKGLEFDTVILIGCVEGVIPHFRATDRQEERRLFYVATTRARDHLIYSAPRKATYTSSSGKSFSKEVEPSPFLAALADPPLEEVPNGYGPWCDDHPLHEAWRQRGDL